MKQKSININRKQKGYIVVITVVLLAALLVSTLGFFDRATRNMKTTAYNRDSAESLLLAESAMNSLIGRFFVEDVDGRNGIDGDEQLNMETIFEATVADPVADQALSYLFFVSQAGATTIDQTKPSILQRTANGEAINSGKILNSKLIDAGDTTLLISNLFMRNMLHPIVFTYDHNNLLQKQNIAGNPAAWNAMVVDNERIAATWFEVVSNPNLAGAFQIYAAAVGLVGPKGANGKSKSYVQRLLGTINTNLGSLSTVNQGS